MLTGWPLALNVCGGTTIIVGMLMTYVGDQFPAHARRIEICGGFLIIAGLGLFGVALSLLVAP